MRKPFLSPLSRIINDSFADTTRLGRAADEAGTLRSPSISERNARVAEVNKAILES
jgi:hypothetical protein